MTACTGRGDSQGGHCCWVKGKVCDFLIENYEGRRFACGLRSELGDWETVYADPRYAPIAAVMGSDGLCGDWQPYDNQCCNEVR